MLEVAALQLPATLGDVRANLARAEQAAHDAALAGPRLIVLPEFFTTGMAHLPEVRAGALPHDGAATELLRRVAAEHGVLAGGSFLARDRDGHVRNAFVLVGPTGVLGRHDKDLPTMWESYAYTGGEDDGIIERATPPADRGERASNRGAVSGVALGLRLEHQDRNAAEVGRSGDVGNVGGEEKRRPPRRLGRTAGGSRWPAIPPVRWRPRISTAKRTWLQSTVSD